MLNKRMAFENELIRFLATEYFDGDRKMLVDHTGYSMQQVDAWVDGNRKPTKATVRYLLSSTIAPELKIVREFFPVSFKSSNEVSVQLHDCLGEHGMSPGVYALYDSLCNLFYVGKTDSSLFKEMYYQLNRPIGIRFPKALSSPPEYRRQATAFISAYAAPLVAHQVYPIDVMSLVIRLSKPKGNIEPGNLKFVSRQRRKNRSPHMGFSQARENPNDE